MHTPKKEYSSSCPECGGNDRFRIWPGEGDNGRYWCRQCGSKGDLIDFLRKHKGLSFQDAADVVGKEIKSGKSRLRSDLSWRNPQTTPPPVSEKLHKPTPRPHLTIVPKQELSEKLPEPLLEDAPAQVILPEPDKPTDIRTIRKFVTQEPQFCQLGQRDCEKAASYPSGRGSFCIDKMDI